MYRAALGELRPPLALPPPCRPGPGGEPPEVPLQAFLGSVRAQLLSVGLMRHNKQAVPGARFARCAACPARSTPAAQWLRRAAALADWPAPPACAALPPASRLGEFLDAPGGAPPNAGRIEEKDMADVPRFLNRCGCVRMRAGIGAAVACGAYQRRAGAALSVWWPALCPNHPPCRLLGLEPGAQQAVFDFYQATLEALMEKARREGALGTPRCRFAWRSGAAGARGGLLRLDCCCACCPCRPAWADSSAPHHHGLQMRGSETSGRGA